MSVNGSASHEEVKAAFDPSKVVPLFLNGQEKTTSTTFDVISPLNNKVCWKCSSASVEDAEAAIVSASKAFKSWSKTKPGHRRDILLRAAQLLLDAKEQSGLYSSTETGASKDMFGFEYNLAYEACLSTAGLISSVQGTIPTTADEGRSSIIVKEPYGVCLGIAP